MTEMIVWGPGRRVLHGVVRAAGVGLLVGAIEVALLGFVLRAPLGVAGFVGLGLVSMALGAALAALAAVVTSPVHWIARGERPSTVLGLHVGLVIGLLAAFHLWQLAAGVWAEGRTLSALFVAIMPVFVAFVAFVNAAWLFRRAERGLAVQPFWLGVLGASAVLVLGAGAVFATRDTGGARALPGAANVLVVLVDGLRADQVRAVTPEATAPTPALSRIAEEGVVFGQAVSPLPDSTAALASVLTGLHPLRHQVLGVDWPLKFTGDSLATLLDAQGYATGAFLSSSALEARTGLDVGFRVYDDQVRGPVDGLVRVRLVRNLLELGGALGLVGEARRSGGETTSRFVAWLADHAAVPFFAVVHYADLAERELPGERWYGERLSMVDGYVGEVLERLHAHGLDGSTLVVVAGTWGAALDAAEGPLADGRLHVPLLLRAPGEEVIDRVEAQVRLFDVRATALEALELDVQRATESFSLLPFARGRRDDGLWTTLVGPPLEQPEVGTRLPLDGRIWKYARPLLGGPEHLYDLTADPRETADEAAQAPEVLDAARERIDIDAGVLGVLLGLEPAEAG